MTFFKDTWKTFRFLDDEDELQDPNTTWLLRFTTRLEEASRYLIDVIPFLYPILYSEKTGYRIVKRAIQLFFGLFLGFLLYELILVDLQLDIIFLYPFTSAICIFLGFGNALSSQVRCLSLLSLVNFSGKSGQTVLKAFIIAYLIAGPINNILNNGQEAVRVLTCHTILTYNLTKSRFTLIYKPFQEAYIQMRTDTTEMKGSLSVLKGIVNPVEKEMEDEKEVEEIKEDNDYMDVKQGESKRSDEIDKKYQTLGNETEGMKVEKNYVRKLQYRCEQMVTKTSAKCRTTFLELFDKCKNTLHFSVSFLCYVVKLTFLCNLFSVFGGEKVCDPAETLGRGFGNKYNFLQNSQMQLRQQFQNIYLEYKVIKIPPPVTDTIRGAYNAARFIIREFVSKKTLIQTVFIIISRLLAFSFIKIIIDSERYLHNYLNDIEFDNFYITGYFREIDFRRAAKGKLTLLPLKQYEYKIISDVYSFRLNDEDRRHLVRSLLQLIVEVLIASTFVILDYVIYTILDILRTHGYIEYLQTGHHDLALDVKGVGMIASLIRSISRGFRVKKTIKQLYTNEACLPLPTHPSLYYLYKIYGSFFLLFILTILNAYILRLRRFICAQFFPKAEKQRIIYLYNERLRNRVNYLDYRLAVVQYEAITKGISDELGFFVALITKYENLFGWLLRFDFARRKCLICRETERPGTYFRGCAHVGCYVYFDKQCWDFVVRRTCIGCQQESLE